jgi:hypothetical protein
MSAFCFEKIQLWRNVKMADVKKEVNKASEDLGAVADFLETDKKTIISGVLILVGVIVVAVLGIAYIVFR